MEKLLSAPLFFALFGIMFLAVGLQRLSRVATEERKGETLLWGSIGLVLAAAFLGMAVWFFAGDRADTQRKQLEIWNRMGSGHE